uniref:Uncharacterized protein n=1 Tax=Amphimedon queenslandica TaxID=400682 RepID=A0A1X7V6C2_AMPQE
MLEIDEALNEAQAVLKQYINKANSLLQGAENVMDNSARSSQLLQDNSKRAESKIQKYFHRMRCILTDREHYFVSILKRSVEEKKREVIEKKAAFKVSMSGIIEGLKSLDDLSKRDPENISILRDQGQVFEKLDGHMSKMSDNINSDSIEVDSSVTMPCFEDQNFEKLCRQVGDPGFRVSTQNVFGLPPSSPLSATPLLSPSLRKNTSQPPAPPVPPRLKSNSVNTIDPRSNSPLTSPLSSPLTSPTGSDSCISNGDGSQNLISPAPPPIPPKSPSHGKKKHPQWLEECKRQYEEEKANDYEVPSVKQNGSQSPGGNKEHVIENGRNGISKNPVPKPRSRTHAFLGETCPSVSPVPKARTKVFKPIEYNDHTVTVEAPTPGTPPLPVHNFTSSGGPPIEPLVVINSRMMTGPSESKEDKIRPYGVCIGQFSLCCIVS